MIFTIGWYLIVLAALVIMLSVKSNKSVKHVLLEAKYELIYNFIGIQALVHDFVWTSKNKTSLSARTGKVALITGGTRGIGAEVIKQLMRCDMTVIMGCRKPEDGENLLKTIRDKGITTGKLHVHQLDVGSLTSVRSFATLIKATYSDIHYLINNAGIMYVPYSESEEGYESQFATNYLGHFLLTHLLLPVLKQTGTAEEKARIVNVTSCAYLVGDIDFENINKKEMFISHEAYAQSKLAQLLFSNYLDKLLEKENANVISYGIHPGIVDTELFNDTWVKVIFWWFVPLIFKNVVQGAIPIVHTCLAPDLESKGGSYISNCIVVEQTKMALDEKLQEKLFAFTKEIVKVKSFGME